ncbi:hypothetical protein B0H63DRAFT_544869 [Podospora didyma]|uniref:Uncharacterized protein n=1 Tax=Podospora didyma TaxID=330526 RepID=A0AAE0NFW3_9PEZI|nr:hypothetical protein B0H63DRAFT_544869 [Podospora didyma]
MLLKRIRPPRLGDNSCAVAFSLVDEFMGYAKRLDMKEAADVDLVEKAVHVLSGYFEHSFLALAIQAKLTGFVGLKLRDKDSRKPSKQGRPLLNYALRPRRVIGSDFPEHFRAEQEIADANMVKLLLERDANPN